ncbi:MAG: filamentous hemagglutinin N-terminal domain-containing protein [Parachlamydiales bacterium]|nr:filamentous hemagglutinin N-terminal domain-containing protein [Parachlamydiales bacterium]
MFRFLLVGSCVCIELFALPHGMQVVSGDVKTSSETQNHLNISLESDSWLDWESFSIDPSEKVSFHFPSPNVCAINRVLDTNPSQILGTMSSNGQVILMNPHGILIGKEAILDMGSFVASTLPVDFPSFQKNRSLAFEGDSFGTLKIEGSVHAERIFLIGKEIEHFGALSAKTNLSIFSCKNVSLSLEGEVFTINCTESKATIFGSIFVPNGELNIYGNEIRLESGALIDVSSPFGGGTVDLGGKNLAPSESILIVPGASLLADAIDTGNGGQIVLWSDRATVAMGFLSAKGGKNSGNGGLIEVSGRDRMMFNWNADLTATNGTSGTLWFDPTDILITTVGPFTAVNFATNPTSWPALTTPVTINSANVAGGLSFFLNNSGSVVITTNVVPDPGAVGTITVNGLVSWNGANSLTLTAASDIIFNAGIQVAGTGNVTVTSQNGNILINSAAGVNNVSIGSRNGTTTVSALGNVNPVGCNCLTAFPLPALPNGAASTACCSFCNPVSGTGNICIRGPDNILRIASIGFAAASGVAVSGNIFVNCNNLNIQGGAILAGDSSPAFIGHGGFVNNANSGNITVTATQTISQLLIGLGGIRTFNGASSIGHVITGSTLSQQSGTITVTAGQDIILRSIGSDTSQCVIGHSTLHGGPNIVPVNAYINVNAGRDIWIDATRMTGGIVNNMGIGHTFASTIAGGAGSNATGDIDIRAGRDLNVYGIRTNIRGSSYIGQTDQGNGGDINSSIRVRACRDINMDPGLATDFGIGAQNALAAGHSINGIITVIAGNDLNIRPSLGNSVGGLRTVIGYDTQVSGGGVIVTTTNVAVGHDINMFANGVTGTRNIGIGGRGDVNVASGNNITLQAIQNQNVYIGTDAIAGTNTTRIFAFGNVVALTNPAAPFTGKSTFGRSTLAVPATGPYSLLIRASGDIQLATGYIVTGGASILLEGDANFSSGDLWNGSITTICGQNAVINNVCPIFTNPSIQSPADGLGTVNVNKGAAVNALVLQTVTGPITIHSGPKSASGAASSLTFGTNALAEFNLTTISGDLTVSGSVPGDAYQNLFVIAPITTAGSVLMIANQNLTLTPTGSIDTSAGNGSVTLVVDNENRLSPLIGNGAFFLNAGSSITTGAGPLTIYTALQPLNSILGLLNGISFTAGTLFANTAEEVWCTYYPTSIPGFPFTIAYKNCLQQATQQAMVIVDQFLVDLHPYNEFPGWMEKFTISYYALKSTLPKEMYYLRRRALNIVNQPKSYTHLNIFLEH